MTNPIRRAFSSETIDEPILVLVEGQDEAYFVQGMIRSLSLRQIQIIDFKGITNLAGLLMVLAGRRDFKDKVQSLAIIRDAEDNPNGAFESVRSALQRAKLPDGNRSGVLEDLLLECVVGRTELSCADQLLACLQESGETFTQGRRGKTRLYAYLASQTSPEKQLHIALESNYFPFDHPAFAHVRKFLHQISNIS